MQVLNCEVITHHFEDDVKVSFKVIKCYLELNYEKSENKQEYTLI